MKIKLIFNSMVALSVIFLVSCTAGQNVRPNIESKILQSQFVSDALNKFMKDGYSAQNVPRS
ncbi:hypothetical protein SAMN04488109_1202 [Chryseolinea serpens]|uniref:Uncharacterized protein n=1 Tax=Chryseolinea serpens TaxID=947013 RepID=A0A1M5LGM3_9BACT|nr:hypothetical protein SAMN04488109_1202 [Chryseolinea serpens]